MHQPALDNLIPQLLERVNLVDIISQDIRLKQNGNNWVGLCPFHSDNKPSFSVSPSKGLYYCFGCQAGGNALSYMKEARGFSFVESVQELAQMAGMDLPDDWNRGAARWREHREKKDLMFEVNELAMLWFAAQLRARQGAPAREYLKGRHLEDKHATTFSLGYAPTEGGLHRELARQGKSTAVAIELGVLWQGRDDPRKVGDRFRGRLVFPIRDLSGHVIGFSARAMEADQQPKYINSSESLVFHKGEMLYGLWEARDGIRKSGTAILVEGQMDVIALHRAGLTNVVAPMGTALTEGQVRLISRFTDRLVVMFDGDEAGMKAADKALKVLLPTTVRGTVVSLPGGEDPDSILESEGAAHLRGLVERGVPFLEWLVRLIAARSEDSMSGRAAAMRDGGTYAGHLLDEMERSQFLEQLGQTVGIETRGFRVSRITRTRRKGPVVAENRRQAGKNELDIVALLIKYPNLLRRLQDMDVTLEEQFNEGIARLIQRLLDQYEETGKVLPATLGEEDDGGDLREILALADYDVADGEAEAALEAKLRKLLKDRLKGRKEELLRKHREAEQRGDAETLSQLGDELDEVLRALRVQPGSERN
ncbi:MAG: DNA primase [Pseudomonadota bacterium]